MHSDHIQCLLSSFRIKISYIMSKSLYRLYQLFLPSGDSKFNNGAIQFVFLIILRPNTRKENEINETCKKQIMKQINPL